MQEIDEISGRVRGFRLLEDQSPELIHTPAGPLVGVGDEQIYAFIVDAQNASVGTLEILRPTFDSFIKENPSHSSLILQIKELTGSDEEKKVARTRMRQLLLEAQGTAAAHSFYEGSVLRSVLWDRLLSVATGNEMSKRILQLRSRLSASINHNGQITLNLEALSEEDRASIDPAKVIAGMLLEFEPHPSRALSIGEAPNPNRDQSHDAARVQRNVNDILGQIHRTGRQEERAALLMASILNDPTIGKSALLQYQGDRAKTANWAIAELRKALIDTAASDDEGVIAKLVPALFTRQWPMTRGDLLFYLAKHLGKWPRVRSAIQETLRRTHSMYVDWSRKEIEEALAAHPSPSGTLQGVARGHRDPRSDVNLQEPDDNKQT